MVRDSVAFLHAQGRRVFFDAEHFFDGYRERRRLRDARAPAAEEAGAERLVLCDTNGGMLPLDIARIVGEVGARVEAPLGIHVHNDAGCAVANSLDRGRARGIPGAGRGERLRRAHGQRRPDPDRREPRPEDGRRLSARTGAVEHLTELAHYVAEVANVAPDSHQPYAGRYAFTHKAGLHASGVARLEEAYEHVTPSSVGNRRGVVASDLGGAATLRMKAEEFGVDVADAAIGREPRGAQATGGAAATRSRWPTRRSSC